MEHRPFHPHRPHLVRPVRRDRDGVSGPTKAQAAGPRWRRTSHGYYVPASVAADDVDQRIVEASVCVPEGYGVTGWAALRWWSDCRWFEGRAADGTPLPVPIVTATHGVRSQPGIEISEEQVRRADVTEHDGLPVISPRAALSFEVRRAPTLRQAVQWLDLAAYVDLVSLREQAAFAAGQNAWTGIPQHRAALALADENAWSPTETTMRLIWVQLADLPPPLCNVPVFDGHGRHLGTPDLLDPEVGVIAEYDGAAHLERTQRARDVRREELFRDHGLEYVTMLSPDLVRPHDFVGRLLRAHGRARSRSWAGRAWTVDFPAWWTPTHTVELRRGLEPWQRERYLRYRAS